MGVEEVERELKEEKKEENEEEKKEKKEEKKENVFERVKERISMRSKKKRKEVKEKEVNEKEVKEQDLKDKEVKEKEINEKELKSLPKIEKEQFNETSNGKKQETGKRDPAEKKKEENIFQRLLNRLSFRSKKKKEKSVEATINDLDNNKEEVESGEDPDLQNETRSLSETSIANDMEISALCGDDNEEKETSPFIPVMSSSRPPLPTIRRPPCSATTAQSRPVSQLDAALKQFKLSTAASRENLRGSRVDISQVEEQVKTMVTSRPSTPTPAGWRSRAPPENTNLADQWTKLSASMTDLR